MITVPRQYIVRQIIQSEMIASSVFNQIMLVNAGSYNI